MRRRNARASDERSVHRSRRRAGLARGSGSDRRSRARTRRPPIACTLETTAWPTAVQLHLRAGTGAFAQLEAGPPATLELPPGPPSQGAPIAVEADGLRIEASVLGGDVPLHPREAFVVKGAVAPKPWVGLRWTGGARGTLDVSMPLGSGVAAPEELAASLGCDQLSIEAREYEAREAIPLPESKTLKELERDVGIPVSHAPGSATVVTLMIDGHVDGTVELLRADGQHSLIVADLPDVFVFGWVPSSRVNPQQAALGGLFGTGGLGLSGVGTSGTPRLFTCPGDIDLHAEVGGRTGQVGVVRSGTRMTFDDRGDRWTRVSFWDIRWIAPVTGAYWLVASGDAEACTAK